MVVAELRDDRYRILDNLAELRDDRYRILDNLGVGQTACVDLVERKEIGGYYAIKFIKRGSSFVTDGHAKKEILIHRSLQHANVIRFVEVVLTPINLGIVMEYANGGTLSDRIWVSEKETKLSEDKAGKFFLQIIAGVGYCHSQGVCHRDLKPNNILIMDNKGKLTIKISDFGLSKSAYLHSTPHSMVGTPCYMAPEVFANKEYGQSADVWSCGCILYAMLMGESAFPDPNDLKNEENTSNRIEVALDLIPASVSPECKDLLRRIFVINPGKRITIEEIKKNQWFLEKMTEELKLDGSNGRKVVPRQSEYVIRLIIKKAESKVPPLQMDDDGDVDSTDV